MAQISIIISVYNTEQKLLNQCLESLMQQTFQDIEIILVDDGSDNITYSLCDQYAEIDQRVNVIHQINGGLSVARNTGIDCATSDWISFVDSDDWVELNMYEEIISVLNRHDNDILTIGHIDEVGQTGINELLQTGYYVEYDRNEHDEMQLCILKDKDASKKYPMFFGAAWKFIYKRSFLNQHNIRNIMGLYRAQDSVFNLYAIQYAKRIAYLNRPLYHYRIHDNSVCHKMTRNINAYTRLLEEQKKFCSLFNKEKRFFQAFDYSVFLFFCESMQLYHFHKNNTNPSTEKKKEFLFYLEKELIWSSLQSIPINYLSYKQKLLMWMLKRKRYFVLKFIFLYLL